MSIISDALKKVEGNSGVEPPMKRDAPQVELVDSASPSSSPPLFSVWSIVLSTVMVLVAAVLLLVPWHANRAPRSAESAITTAPLSSPVEVAAVPAAAVPEVPIVLESPAASAVRSAALHTKPVPVVKPEVKQPAIPVAAAPPPATVKPTVEVAASAPVEPTPVPPVTTPIPKPTPEAPRGGDELVLTGVIYTPRVRMAHINGKILPEGAEIEGYRIVTISRESVRLSKDDKFYILRLKR